MSPDNIARDAADMAVRLLPIAVQGVGPMRGDESHGRYMERVRALAIDLWIESGPRAELTRRLAELMDAQVFVGVLTGVEIEPSSTRAILTLTVIRDGEAAEESIRTDRTDGPAGRTLWEAARALIGHRVALYKHMETRADPNKKYRCAKHIVDLGLADDAEEVAGAPSPRPTGHPSANRPVVQRLADRPATGAERFSGPVSPPRRPGSSILDARREIMAVLDRSGHTDPGYREAACSGIMNRVRLDGVVVTNLDALLHLAGTTPPADTPAGGMIMQRYGQQQRLSA